MFFRPAQFQQKYLYKGELSILFTSFDPDILNNYLMTINNPPIILCISETERLIKLFFKANQDD